MSLWCMWSAVKKVEKKVGEKLKKTSGKKSREKSEKNLKARKKSGKEKSSTKICMELTGLRKKDTLFERLKEK